MYDVLLAPTDGSDETKPVIKEACALATLTRGTVHGLYVFDTTKYTTLPESKLLTIEDELAEQGEQAQAMIEACAQTAGVSVKTAQLNPTIFGVLAPVFLCGFN